MGVNIAGGEAIYVGQLKKTKVYVTKTSLAVIDPREGRQLDMLLKDIRSAYPITDTTVRVVWRAPKLDADTRLFYWHMYRHNIELDLKKMHPDKKARKEVEKTKSESKLLAKTITDQIQKVHGVTKPNTESYLALHKNESMIAIHGCESTHGLGKLFVTTDGVYFVSQYSGMIFGMPLSLLDSYECNGGRISIQYFVPMWPHGGDYVSRKNVLIQFLPITGDAGPICEDIKRAFNHSSEIPT